MGNPWIAFLLVPLVKIIVILLVVILMAAYLSYFERKILAYMQIRIGPNRVGPRGWLQPIADALKLFVKEDIVPSRAEKLVYMIAPALITAPALVVFSVIPFGADTTFFGLLKQPMPPYLTDINIGILFVLGVSSVGVYGVILGGWSSNNKFSLMGGMRSAAQLVSYEVPMGFSVVAVLLMAGSLSMVKIVEAQKQAGVWFVFPGIVAFFIYIVCGVAETNRNPFDLPEAESELVAGFHTEYSGMKWAFYFLAEYANMVLISSVATVLFLGGWLRPFPNAAALAFLDVIPPFIWFAAKVGFFLFCYIWFRGTFPRYRFDQLMALGWKVLLPVSLANLLVVGLGVLLMGGPK
ncbi:MAG: NADH-quinone oxidoreductase subunit H [Acidobacteria bacterium RBG_13_68_16]|jgi:NADH-quinone oxidoreductase subunit H|nr:MAG: NADH-quinone oxidoreductase subunit H [Acidobacteria bacterium RBG_13_68_16]